MKKNIILLNILLIFGLSIPIYAQVPKINELSIPSSPAFVLLDQSPASIEKPTNPKALAISLINIWEGNGAVEFTPYWLYNHKDYTFENDVKNHSPFWQTFAISGATAKAGDTTSISVGFRVQLFRKYSREEEILGVRDLIINELSNGSEVNKDEIKRLMTDLNTKRGQINWNVELAGAYAGQSTESSGLKASKFGGWLNIRYSPNGFPVDILALGRYSEILYSGKSTDNSQLIDFGGAISKQGEEFDLQLEYVYRQDTTLDESYNRFTFVANYQIFPGVVAVASIGKDFDKVQNVFSTFGIKFGLSNQKVN
jgi:hypothetical protein